MEDLVGGHYWIGSGCFIDGTAFQLVESPAPGIIDKQWICEPVQTGSIIYRFYDTDWMWSGKTSIGIDTIGLHLHLLCINQPIIDSSQSITGGMCLWFL